MKEKTLLSELTQSRFDAGFDWIDTYKDATVLLVEGENVKPITVDDAEEISHGTPRFLVYVKLDHFSHHDLNFFQAAIEHSDDPMIYVQSPQLDYDLSQAWASPLFFAGLSNLNIDNLVFPITSIAKRVDISNFLESTIVAKYNSLFDSRVMGGPVSYWRDYFSLYKSLLDSGMIEHTTQASRDLCLNLFAACFPSRFNYLRIEHEIPVVYDR